MNIKSISELKQRDGLYDVNNHNYSINTKSTDFLPYEVTREEAMRIDLVALSMYDNDSSCLQHIDVLLHINGIDNPMNILAGQILYYPPTYSDLDSYRYELTMSGNKNKTIKDQIAVPNKTTRKDSNRQSFVDNGYSLPPTVSADANSPVRIEDDKIIVGGINKK